MYAKAFFDLQLRFADRVTALSGLPLSGVLLDYTNFYIRFGLGRGFDAAHPTWQAFLGGLRAAHDVCEWTYQFYVTRAARDDGPFIAAGVGCFAYTQLNAGRIRLHFRNTEGNGESPLARERADRRVAELAALLAHVKRSAPETLRVVGASWLYNLAAYRRLFPPSYVATARALSAPFRHMPLWGQFLDRHGALREKPAREFLDRLERQSDVDDLDRCFPLQVLSVGAPVQDFYTFYGVA